MNYLRHLNGFFERLDQDKRLSSYHISLYLALFRQWNICRFADRFVVSRLETMDLTRIGSANTYARCMRELSEWGYIHSKPSSNLHCGSTVSCIRFYTETGSASGIKTDTGNDTTDDTGTSGNLKSDTSGNTATDTSIEYDTATDTGDDTASSIGTAGDIRNDTPESTASDTGIASGSKTDTASGTPLINIINKNKQEENQKKKKNPKEKEKTKKREREENPKTGLKENLKEKTDIPDYSEVVSFFEQNHFLQSEAQKFYARYQSAGWKTGDNQKIIYWQALARKWMTSNKKNNSHERPFNQVGAGRLSVPAGKDYSEPL